MTKSCRVDDSTKCGQVYGMLRVRKPRAEYSNFEYLSPAAKEIIGSRMKKGRWSPRPCFSRSSAIFYVAKFNLQFSCSCHPIHLTALCRAMYHQREEWNRREVPLLSPFTLSPGNASGNEKQVRPSIAARTLQGERNQHLLNLMESKGGHP